VKIGHLKEETRHGLYGQRSLFGGNYVKFNQRLLKSRLYLKGDLYLKMAQNTGLTVFRKVIKE
jgi:hypothetical protein